MKKIRISASTIRAYLVSLICLAIPVMLIAFVMIFNSIEKKMYEKTIQIQCEKVAAVLGERLDSISGSSVSLFKMSWFTHYNTVHNLYNKEFNINLRADILKQLSMLTESFQFADDVIVVIPAKGTVVAASGWYGLRDYTLLNGLARIGLNAATGEPVVEPLDPDKNAILAYASQKTNAPAAVCVILSLKRMESYVRSLDSTEFPYMCIECGGQALLQFGDESKCIYRHSVSSGKYVPIRVTLGYDPTDSDVFREAFGSYAWVVIMAFCLLFVMAAILTAIRQLPLQRIIKRNSEAMTERGRDPYQQIDDMITHAKRENSELREANASISQSMLRLQTMVRNELICSMLTSSQFDFSNPIFLDNYPWVQDGLPFILIIAESEDDTVPLDPPQVERFLGESLHQADYRFTSSQLAIILWYASAEEGQRHFTAIQSALSSSRDEGLIVVESPLLTEVSDISDMYHDLEKQLQQSKRTDCGLTVRLQLELSSGLQSGQSRECVQLLRDNMDTYTPDIFLTFLHRIAGEYGIEIPKERENGIGWDQLFRITESLCRQFDDMRKSDSQKSADLIRAYIDEHFSDPDMCIKTLAEIFGLNGSLISKVFKSSFDVTFSEYLLQKRMEYATGLLADSSQTLSGVAEKSGYINYYSFKRAFTRYKGISPREYRDRLKN